VASELHVAAIADSEVTAMNYSVVFGDGSSRASNDRSCTVSDNGVDMVSGDDNGVVSSSCDDVGPGDCGCIVAAT
jgi:hypothetical protein